MVKTAKGTWVCERCGDESWIYEDRPPHFPDPNYNPIALLEARVAEQDEIIAAQYAEMTAWRKQLEEALLALEASAGAHERAERLYKRVIELESM